MTCVCVYIIRTRILRKLSFYLEQAPSQEPVEGSQEDVMYTALKKIKDEPIDEDYDKALISSASSDTSRVKEELENGDHEVRFI